MSFGLFLRAIDKKIFWILQKETGIDYFFFVHLVDKTDNSTSNRSGFQFGWDHTRFRVQATNFEFEFWRWRVLFPCLEILCWFEKKYVTKLIQWSNLSLSFMYMGSWNVGIRLDSYRIDLLLVLIWWWWWWWTGIAKKMLMIFTLPGSISPNVIVIFVRWKNVWCRFSDFTGSFFRSLFWVLQATCTLGDAMLYQNAKIAWTGSAIIFCIRIKCFIKVGGKIKQK